MTPTIYQKPEIRDANDNIIQQGAFGKNTALANATNDGWIDYVANDLEFLYGLAKDEVVPVSALPASGDMNKTYLLTTTGVCYRWDGTAWVEISSSEAVGRAETAANLAEQWATKTDGTVADNEYSAKYYANAAQQSADDAQDVADDMATHLAQIDQNTGGVSANSKRIGNIEKLLQGNLYDYDTDDDTAYTKTVPSGAMPYAGIEKVGGKTVVWNQLITFSSNTKTSNGVTYTFNGDDMTVTCSGTATGYAAVNTTYKGIAGHKTFFRGCPAGGSTETYATRVSASSSVQDTGNGAIVTEVDSGTKYLIFIVRTDVVSDGIVFKPMVVDLTQMFGAGNEPSTVAEFEAMFPADYYSYNNGELLSAGVTEVVSKDSNNATLQTYSIPAAIQALNGYGWGTQDSYGDGASYNYIDFERKKFVKVVDKYVFSNSTYVVLRAASKNETEFTTYFKMNIPSRKAKRTYIVNGMLSPSIYVSNLNYRWDIHFSCMLHPDNIYSNLFYVVLPYTIQSGLSQNSSDNDLQDAAKEWILANNIELYYELAEPVETDISAYLTDDNLIEVEAGGTLTFPNSNGDDYRLPVPSDVTYMIDLQSAIGG